MDIRRSGKFCNNRKTFRLSRLEKLLDTRKTLCDIVAGNTARMECTHGKLRTRLTDRLRRNNTDSFTYLYWLTGRHIGAVTLRTDTIMRLTGKDRPDLHLSQCIPVLIHTLLHNQFRTLWRYHMIRFHKDIAILVNNIFTQIASRNTLL